MTKILCLAPYQFLPARVGGQKHIALFYKYLCRHVSLTCSSAASNDAALAEGYVLRKDLSSSPLRYVSFAYFFRLKKLIKEEQYTHLLLEHPYYGWLGVWLQRSTGIKLIVRSHNIEGLRWKGLGKWWWKILLGYEGWTHSHADYNFFIQDADKAYAMDHFSLEPRKCITVTYGIEWNKAPDAAERKAAKNSLMERHHIPANHSILLFNGAFNYPPNLQALERIVNILAPLLQQHPEFPCTIVICGSHIPDELVARQIPHIIWAGFVNDIGSYLKGADLFLNPITEGGGIKTKLVEALGHGLNAVSTRNGAVGVDPAICNGKLVVTDNDDWEGFAWAIIRLAHEERSLPALFFDRFYWDHIAATAARFIEQ